ncbi:MAG: PVC-type heme-binding CxxCH protein [Gemmataceae bacterium]
MRVLLPAMLGLALATLLAAEGPAPQPAAQTLQGHAFTLPPGFTITSAIKPGLVDRPITLDLDEQGRLYVAESSGSNAPVAQQVKEPTHRIVRLEDRDGDGIYDTRTVFADKVMFPEGTLWYDGSLYVAAPPSIWKFTDTNGDGIADQRSEWFQGKTLTGCANDLHGPYLGPDGWIYWAKGAFAQQTYPRPGRKPLVTKASHLFRARPDGTGIEPVMTGGMDNPVDVVFLPSGERVFTTTFFQHPAGGRRDGLIHAVYGGVYGKDHAPVYDHPWTAPTLMPVLTHMGPAAPAGLASYDSTVFGPGFFGNLFAAQFNLQKISRHVLTPSGATFTSRDEDFVVSSNRDFHPTDVMEDADGSLLVVDTGGWYKLCCPSSQLVKTDVMGGIYRVRKQGAASPADPRGLKLAWERLSATQLAELLADPRPAVVRRALHLLGKRGAEAVPAIATAYRNDAASARRQAVWAATRIDAPAARDLVRRALDDRDASVRQVALHSISLWRDRGAIEPVLAQLKHPSAAVRRVAAEALGRLGDARAVPALLATMSQPADRMLEHSLIYALLEMGQREATAQGLASADPRQKRAALIALDGMDNGNLRPEEVTPALEAKDPALREAAWWIAGRRPAWGASMTAFFRKRMQDAALSAAQRDELVAQLARFASNPAIQTLLADRLREGTAPEKRLVLQAMTATTIKPVPPGWVEALTRQFEGSHADLLGPTLTTIRTLPLDPARTASLIERLRSLAADERASAEIRLGAMAAVPGGLASVSDSILALLLGRLDKEQPVLERALAVEVLTRARLTSPQMLQLATALATTGPMELDRLLDAFARTTDAKVGQALVQALRTAPARTSLRVDGIRSRLGKYGPEVQKELAVLVAALDADLARQKEQLERTLETLKGGDVRRGQLVFNSQKAGCAACHAIGYLGGKIGPDLTRIGGIRSERDLVEAILYPSASFVRSYEPVQVVTVAGKSYNGLIKRETPEELTLTISALEEVRVPRSQIEELQPSKVSIMPAGLDKILTTQELADLVAFLRACR